MKYHTRPMSDRKIHWGDLKAKRANHWNYEVTWTKGNLSGVTVFTYYGKAKKHADDKLKRGYTVKLELR